MKKVIKPEKIILPAVIIAMFAGVIIGAVYMAYQKPDDELFAYLEGFFATFTAGDNRLAVFKNSLGDNLKLLIVLIISGFFKAGIAMPIVCSGIKGFINGFTTAAFCKYYGLKGLFVSMSSFLSTVIYIPVLIAYCTFSGCFSLKKKTKNNVASFFLFSLGCLSIFCLVSFFDGYVTTTFMKLLKPFIVKI